MPPGMEENIIGVRVSNAVRSTQYFYEGSSGFVFGIIVDYDSSLNYT